MTLREQVEQWKLKAVQSRMLAKGFPKLATVNEAAAEMLEQCAADVLALLPAEPMTCATCRHLSRQRLPNDEYEGWCALLLGLELDSTPDNFGCTLYQPKDTSR